MTPEQLQDTIASWLSPESAHLAPVIAGLAEEYAAALLGGRHRSCGKRMPLARSTCGLGEGHRGFCKSIATAEANRARTKRRTVRLALAAATGTGSAAVPPGRRAAA